MERLVFGGLVGRSVVEKAPKGSAGYVSASCFRRMYAGCPREEEELSLFTVRNSAVLDHKQASKCRASGQAW